MRKSLATLGLLVAASSLAPGCTKTDDVSFVLPAANGRIGVAWITGQRIELGEELGGWAVLACR